MSFSVDLALPDVQGRSDMRRLAIQRAGICAIRYPILVAADDGALQPATATWSLMVRLPENQKGTHMSRFVALLEAYRSEPMSPQRMRVMAQDMLRRLDADRGDLSVVFPYFMLKSAPVSGEAALVDYEVRWTVRAAGSGTEFELQLTVPVTSLCPCSKAISDYGAHNQRSNVVVRLGLEGPVDLEALIRRVEAQGSCEIWSLLKRPDEKYVTERAYENPRFVEDLVRDVAAAMRGLPGLSNYRISAENLESIHNHSAYAEIWG